MTRRFGSPKRTNAQLKAAMDMRLTLCTDWALSRITVEELQRNGFYRQEAEERLRAERERRGMAA